MIALEGWNEDQDGKKFVNRSWQKLSPKLEGIVIVIVSTLKKWPQYLEENVEDAQRRCGSMEPER